MNYDGTNIFEQDQLDSIIKRVGAGGASSATMVMNIEGQSLSSNLNAPYDKCLPVRGFSYGLSRPSIRRGASGEYVTGSDIFAKPLIIVADFAADLCEMITRVAEMKNLGKLTIMELTHTGSYKQEVKTEHLFGDARLIDVSYEPGVTVMGFRYNNVNISSVELASDSTSEGSKGNKSGGANIVKGVASNTGGAAGGGEGNE